MSQKVSNALDQVKINNEIDELFNKKCEIFTIKELLQDSNIFSSYKIKGIRNAEPNIVYIKATDNMAKRVLANMHLIAESDNATFMILEKDVFNPLEYPISIGDETYPVKCYKLMVKLSETKSNIPIQQIVNNHIEQSINVQGNGNQINQNAAVEQQFAQIQGEIDKVKGFFNNGKKKTAQDLFGNFKKCILTHQKDENLFSKFLKILRELSLTVAASLVEQLILTTFNR